MTEKIYGEFKRFYLLPLMLNDIYADVQHKLKHTIGQSQQEQLTEDDKAAKADLAFVETAEYIQNFNSFFAENSHYFNKDISDVTNNSYSSAVEANERIFNSEKVFNSTQTVFDFAQSIFDIQNRILNTVGGVNEIKENAVISASENWFYSDVSRLESNEKLYFGMTDKSTDIRKVLEKQLLSGRNSEQGYIDSRRISRVLNNSSTSHSKSESKEIVINLGGITQNISGGGGADIQDIGQAVAQCILNALNTTAEGVY